MRGAPRVALVHDWLTGMRGGERVLEALLDIVPNAEIFTLIHRRGTVSAGIEARRIHESVLGRIPGARRHYRYLLPAFPAAIERFRLDGFDIVISSSHCVAKGIVPPPGTPHLCYCHTPMRYVRDQYADYFAHGHASIPVRAAAALFAPRLRAWDAAASKRVTRFVANSENVRDRIRRFYSRDADVIHPPVDVSRFTAGDDGPREDLYVCVSALVPYKRIDIAIDACRHLGRRLLVIGEGPEWKRLSRRAGPGIELAGRASDAEVADALRRARAFILPGAEDFGIAPVEAQAAGTPVIALGRGGALETVIDGQGAGTGTGIFFDDLTATSLAAAIERFETLEFDRKAIRANAGRFAPEHFDRRMRACIDAVLEAEPECASFR